MVISQSQSKFFGARMTGALWRLYDQSGRGLKRSANSPKRSGRLRPSDRQTSGSLICSAADGAGRVQ